ncbi:MAG: hypothetical protein H5U19_14585 [Rhodobacteraceae bacterium]|jgi:hypothetical protein|nr:hypothetical protein [Paracoccaceae bacterium]
MKRIAMVFAAFVLGAGAVQADTLGTITANWQGKEQTWFVTAKDGESQSSHDDSAKVIDMFALWGNPRETDLAATSNTIVLSFYVMRGPRGKEAHGTDFYYLLSGFSDRWEAGQEATEVSLELFDKTDTTVHVRGTFHASPKREVETTEIDGVFDVTFPLD